MKTYYKILENDYIIHNTYGDMRNGRSVAMPNISKFDYPIEEKSLFIHLTMTMKCNGRCKGCINSHITNKNNQTLKFDYFELDVKREAKAIMNLASKENKDDIVVCLYGGEPLLASDKIVELMHELSKDKDRNYRYMLYTNGLFIEHFHNNHKDIKNKIWLYSISIDGQKQQHESVRCGINYDKIKQNLQYLKSMGESQNTLMWSTLREEQRLKDCFEAYLSLLNEGLIQHWFWHFVETEERFNNLNSFAKFYEKDLRYIMDIYMEYLKQGKILSIIHINELILYLLSAKNRGTSACGVELSTNFDIIGGKIQVCSDLPEEYNIGYIEKDGEVHITKNKLDCLLDYKKSLQCSNCGIHPYCGGRCPVQAITGATRLKEYCQLLRLHVAVVNEYIEQIENIMSDNESINPQKIYTKSAKYDQYTDVTP